MSELRRDIIDAAMKNFKEVGMNFTLDVIASDLHISKKTIYKVFENKEELLLSMLDEAYENIYLMKERILKSNLNLIDKIKQVMIALPDEYMVFDYRHIDQLKDQYPLVHKRMSGYLNSEWDPIVKLLEEGMKEKIIKKIDIPTFKQIFTSSIEGFLYSNFLYENKITYEEALGKLIDYLVDGIKE